jgi:hypothetical protein
MDDYRDYVNVHHLSGAENLTGMKCGVDAFAQDFCESSTKSIDVFMARNPKRAPVGKYIISFEILKAEERSQFREHVKVAKERYSRADGGAVLSPGKTVVLRGYFQGDDWYSYLFDRLTEGLVAKDVLPDFVEGKVAFITFNYDRSLEYFLYESLRKSFGEVPEDRIGQWLRNLRILHLYGQVAPLKWQDPNEGVDYHPQQIDEALLQKAGTNIKTIYEEKESPELTEAHKLLESAERIFFLGFGYASENMEVLNLLELIAPGCEVYGTAFTMEAREVEHIRHTVHSGRRPDSDGHRERYDTTIEPCDCLMLLRKYL